jgi:hypothetical protein
MGMVNTGFNIFGNLIMRYGKSCKEVGRNAFEIMKEVTQLLLTKKKIGGAPDADIVAKCDGFMRELGKIDACFASLRQICPMDEEHARSRKACEEMMIEWRQQGYNIPLKAHICEHHFCDFSEICGGLGDFDEEFVEQYHQKGKTADARYKTPYMEKKSFCVLKHEAISSDKDVTTNMIDVNTNSKHNLKKRPAAEVRLQEQNRVKMERRDKHIKGES